MKLKFKSSDPDLSFNSINLEIINKNLLYLTHTMDKCLVVLKEMEHDKNLQHTVDKYFEETSHQTDSDTNASD